MLLPEEGDFSQLGVKKKGLHFVTAGSKGECHFWSLKGGTSVTSLLLLLGCVLRVAEALGGGQSLLLTSLDRSG